MFNDKHERSIGLITNIKVHLFDDKHERSTDLMTNMKGPLV